MMWERLAEEGGWREFKERVSLAGGELKDSNDPDFGLGTSASQDKIDAHRKRYWEKVRKEKEAQRKAEAEQVRQQFEAINAAKAQGEAQTSPAAAPKTE